jgi:uncharacterized protein
MLDSRLLDILVCPGCRGDLEYAAEGNESLICRNCRVAYPVRDGIPVMLLDEALPLDENTDTGKKTVV